MLGVPNVAPISTGAVVSRSVNPRIVLGPLFFTVIRYSTGAPATGSPLVLAFRTARSASPEITSVTVAVLLSRFGSVTSSGGMTSAVFSSRPTLAGGTVPVSVIVTDWPVASISPVHAPVAGSYKPMLGVPKVAPMSPGAVVSVSVKPVTVVGPLFATSIR